MATYQVGTQSELVNVLSSASSGDIITLTAQITGDGFSVPDGVTIDFNAHTYTLGGGKSIITAGDVTLTNGTLSPQSTDCAIQNGGTLTFDGCVFDPTTTFSNIVSNTTDSATIIHNVGSRTYLAQAINSTAADSNVTIKLTNDISGINFNVAQGKRVTVDFNGYIYTLTNTDAGTVAEGATLTLRSNGSTNALKADTYSYISNAGTLALDNVTLSNVYLNSSSNVPVTLSGANDLKLTGDDGYYTLENGRTFRVSANATLKTNSDKTATLNTTNFTDATNSPPVTYSASNNTLTFNFGSDGKISVSKFYGNYTLARQTSSLDAVTYRVVGNGLIATDSSGNIKIYNSDVDQNSTIALDDLINDANFADAYLTTAAFELNKSTLGALNTDYRLVYSSDYSVKFGTLTRLNADTYALTKSAGDGSLTQITINDGLSVQLGSEFVNTPITVNGATLTAAGASFTVSSVGQNSLTSVNASVVSLIGGSIVSAANQSVAAGNYSVSGYSGSDGINIARNSNAVSIGDIDQGESFTVNDITYTRTALGLVATVNSAAQIYTGTTSATADALTVNLAELASGLRPYIAPDADVLVVGSHLKESLAIVESTLSPAVSYGLLNKTGNTTYELTTVFSGDADAFQQNVAAVSLTGGTVSVNKNLVGADMAIRTKAATFIVTAVNGDTFTVDADNNAPAIANATAVTLINGTITTLTGTQAVNLNDIDTLNVTYSRAGMTVSFDGTTAYIKASAGDTFTLGGKAYTVGGDGLTFVVSAGGLSITDLATADSDTFTLGDDQFSVRPAGFIRYSDGEFFIWGGSYAHSLVAGTVTYDELTNSDNWTRAVTVNAVNSVNAVTLPSTTADAVLVGYDTFADTFGTVTLKAGAATVSTVDATATLKHITFDAGTIKADAGFVTGRNPVTVNAANATLAILDDDGDGFELALTANEPAYVSDGVTITLIGGSLKSDSTFSAYVHGDLLTGIDDTQITITADSTDATVSDIDLGEAFTVAGGGSYTRTVVGLVNSGGKYLLASNKDSLSQRYINTAGNWGKLLASDALTLTAGTGNGLIVDNTTNPQRLLGEYDSRTSVLSAGASAWRAADTINIDDTTVSLTSDFAGNTIHGVKSKATFSVSDNTTISVTDVQTGAVIGATNITQTAGTVSVTSNAQVLNTAFGTISGGSNLTVIVSGLGTSVGAIDTNDEFTVNGESTYTKYGAGLMDGSDRILLNTGNTTEIGVDELMGGDWKKTDIIDGSGVLTIPDAPGSSDEWIIVDNGRTTINGTLTSGSDSAITVNRTNTGFALKASVSGAVFSTDATQFDITDGAGGATISTGALNISQTGGVIALSNANQSVSANGYVVNFGSQSSGVDGVRVSVSSTAVKVAGLDTDDTFMVDGVGYELLSNGRLRRLTDGKVYNGATVATSGGSIDVASLSPASNWNAIAELTSDADFVIDAAKIAILGTVAGAAAYVVDETNNLKYYGTLVYTGTGYSLSTDGQSPGYGFSTVTVTKDAGTVTLTGAFKDIPVIADNTATVTSPTSSEFALKFDGTIASVEATNTALNLLGGTVQLSDVSQTINSGANVAQVTGGTISVSYDGLSGTKIGGLDAAGDAALVNGTAYAYGGGDGLSVELNGTAARVADITDGDAFTINNTGFYAGSGYLIKDSASVYSEYNISSASVSRLIGTQDWTAIIVSGSDLTVNNAVIGNGIIMDSASAPTKSYGELVKIGSGYSLSASVFEDTLADSVYVDGVRATVGSAYAGVNVALAGATVSYGASVISGSVSQVVLGDMSFTPSTGDVFAVNSAAYVMTDAGLTSDGKIWTEDTHTYHLPTADAWSHMLMLDGSGTLNLVSHAAQSGSNIIVDAGCTDRRASLSLSGGTYTFASLSASAVDVIEFDSMDANVETDFETRISTGAGTYRVNGVAYAGSDMEIAATRLKGKSSSYLVEGVVSIDAAGVSVTCADTQINALSGVILASASSGVWQTLGSLDNADTFSVDGTSYQVVGTHTLIKDANQLYLSRISGSTLSYSDVLSGAYLEMVSLEGGTLNLTHTFEDGTYIAVTDAEHRVASLSFAENTGFTLSACEYGNVSLLSGVKMSSAVATLNTEFDTQIETSDVGTFVINGRTFAAQDTLSIATGASFAALVEGSVRITSGSISDVVTRQVIREQNVDQSVAALAGTLIVAVEDNVVGLSALDASDAFSINGTSYLMTSAGLARADKTQLNTLLSGTSLSTDDLSSGWENVLDAPQGVLSIDASTAADVVVVDLSDATDAKTYGELSKNAANVYSLNAASDLPKNIVVDGAKLQLQSVHASAKITAVTSASATFTVEPSGATFLIDASGTDLTVSGASSLTIEDGQMPLNETPIYAAGMSVVNTGGQMSVVMGLSGAQITDLNEGESFTVDGVEYKMAAGCLLKGTQKVTQGVSADLTTVTLKSLASSTLANILAPNNGTLNLRSQSLNAQVYNSTRNPKTEFGTLTVANEALTLSGTSAAAANITNVNIAGGSTLNVDFATKVNALSGAVEVNGVAYDGATSLIIQASADSSALYGGTVALHGTYKAVTGSVDNAVIEVTNGSLSVAAQAGYLKTLSGLNVGESFTVDGVEYTRTEVGLMSGSSAVAEALNSDTLNLSALAGADWRSLMAATGSTLDLTDAKTSNVYDSLTPPTQKFGTLTVTNNQYTFKGTTAGASALDAVILPSDAKLTLDIAALISTSGAVEVNGSKYSAASALTLKSDGKTSALHAGTVNLDAQNYLSVTDSANTSLRVGANTSLKVTASGGTLNTLSDLDSGESFTYKGVTYKRTDFGLMAGAASLCADFSDTLNLSDLASAFWENMLAPISGTLDISAAQNAQIFDSTNPPSQKLATLTLSGATYTLAGLSGASELINSVNVAKDATLVVNFDTLINSPNGALKVNGKSYTGVTSLTVASDGTTSALHAGTVALDAGESVTTSDNVINVTDGDGLSVNVTSAAVTLGKLNSGDVFKVDTDEYMLNSVGLFKLTGGEQSVYKGTVDVLNTGAITLEQLESGWRGLLNLTDGKLTLDANTLENGSVLLTESGSLSSNYGMLTRAGASSYTLSTDSTTNTPLLQIALAGVSAALSTHFADVDIFANATSLNGITYKNSNKTFTVDATSDSPKVLAENVSALTLVEGTLTGEVNQTVTTSAGYVITPTSGDMIIGVAEISGLSSGETFTLDGDTYKVFADGLFNATDKTLVTSGFDAGAFNIADRSETQALTKIDGAVTLAQMEGSAAVVVDNLTTPTEKLGTLGKSGTAYTADFDTDLRAAAGTLSVNGREYTGTTTLIITADATNNTSALKTGTVTLAAGKILTTVADSREITSLAGDGLTLKATSSQVTLSSLTSGDEFTVGTDEYKVTSRVLLKGGVSLWRGSSAYTDALTLTELDTAANWQQMLLHSGTSLSVDGSTLATGTSVVLVNNISNPTATYGMLSRGTDGTYTLSIEDGDTLLKAITLTDVEMTFDNALEGAQITAVTADANATVFTPSVVKSRTNFTVDATGDIPSVSGAASVEVSAGAIAPAEGVAVTVTSSPEDVTVTVGNGTWSVCGETIVISGDKDSSATIAVDDDGTFSGISGLDKNAKVTIDGNTYTSPADNSTLHYTAADGWYFVDYTLDAYTVTVRADGKVEVDPGVKFTDVLSSSRTFDGTLTFAADIEDTPVTVVNKSSDTLNITDANGNTLASNLGTIKAATFSYGGVVLSSAREGSGATFNLEYGQSLIGGEDSTITADEDCAVTLSDKGRAFAVTGSATVTAPADTALTLSAGKYTLNGVTLTASGDTNATLNDDGVTVYASTSEPFEYDGMTFADAGTVTVDKDGNITVAGGVEVSDANGKTLIIADSAVVDGKTVVAEEPTQVTFTKNGLVVGDTDLTVKGDSIYTVNIGSDSAVDGLENIGSADGVTIAGLDTSTVLTDAAGALTVDKTFNGGAGVTWSIVGGKLVSAQDAGTISGDFSDGLTVNEKSYTVAEGTATVDTDGNVLTAAGTYTVNGHVFTASEPPTFLMRDEKVTGASLSDGTFAIHQDETGFAVNGDALTLAGNTEAVTLNVSASGVEGVYGVNGLINGLDEANVYDVTGATINGTPLALTGATVDALVEDSTFGKAIGLDAGATVTTAPTLDLQTAENGSFTFNNGEFVINDTDDGSVDFLTDSNSRAVDIANFVGELSGGGVSNATLNGDRFAASTSSVTVATDGENITSIYGISSGDSLGGDLSEAAFVIPEGSVTVNGAAYTLAGDADGVILSDDGKTITDLDRDGVITLGSAGSYNINGETFEATAGDAFTANRDGVYRIDPNHKPVKPDTDPEEILSSGASAHYVPETVSGGQSFILSGASNIVLVDSANAPTSVVAGEGNDSVVVRNNAEATVDVASGNVTITPVKGKVTLENYDDGDDAKIQTFDYNNIAGAVKHNDIKFGDGVMTLGDGVITFNDAALSKGSTFADIINSRGDEQAVAFTHTAGGVADASKEIAPYIMKGNYAESLADTQKSAGSSLYGGAGNDTLLVGAGDLAEAGAGSNQIYITDPSLRGGAATIVLASGKNTVHNFNDGYATTGDRIQVSDISALEFGYGSAGLTMSSGDAELVFDGLKPDAAAVTLTGADASLNSADPYELKIAAGRNTYNAAIAQNGSAISVADSTAANVFYGNGNGISFTEYTGPVAVNLNNDTGTLSGKAVQFNDIDAVAAGSGNTTLTGADGTSNTLMAGTGNTQIRSGRGADLMVGSTYDDKTGRTTYYYTAGYGRDTITNFDFATSASDSLSDYIEIDVTNNVITYVGLSGNNVVIGLNDSENDYLTIADAKAQHMVVDDAIAKVDTLVAFDGFTDCYVGAGTNATLSVSSGMGDVDICLGDDEGTQYLGEFTVLNAAAADGSNILIGNEFNNMIIGGTGKNSLWGGDGATNDTLVAGSGSNTFFFATNNGNDVITGTKDGDVVDLSYVAVENISNTTITEGGVMIDLTDGSHLEVQSNAAVDYKLANGTTYNADHSTGEWNAKS